MNKKERVTQSIGCPFKPFSSQPFPKSKSDLHVGEINYHLNDIPF